MCTIFYIDFKTKTLLEKIRDQDELTAIGKDSNRDKLAFFKKLIKDGLTQVIVNGYMPKVSLPKKMMKNKAIPINWSHKFNIKDFQYDLVGVRGTLSFSKKPHFVDIPWESVWLIQHPDQAKSSKIWKEDSPPDFDISGFNNQV